MSLLVDRDILEAIKSGQISIDPFDEDRLGPNSYDVMTPSSRRIG